MAVDFRSAEVEDALARLRPPAIFSPNQGRQYTGAALTGMLRKSGITIGSDRDGRQRRQFSTGLGVTWSWRDNVFGARLWRSGNYEV